MASQGPNSPASATTSNANGGTIDWINPTNAEVADGSSALAGGIDGTTYYLKLTDFGFSIPVGATIAGIVVEILRDENFSTIKDATVKPIDKTGAVVGDNKADTGTEWPTSLAYASYGGTLDTWGISALNVGYVNDANTGVAVAVTVTSLATANIDHVRMTVHYSDAAQDIPHLPTSTPPRLRPIVDSVAY